MRYVKHYDKRNNSFLVLCILSISRHSPGFGLRLSLHTATGIIGTAPCTENGMSVCEPKGRKAGPKPGGKTICYLSFAWHPSNNSVSMPHRTIGLRLKAHAIMSLQPTIKQIAHPLLQASAFLLSFDDPLLQRRILASYIPNSTQICHFYENGHDPPSVPPVKICYDKY